MPMLEILIQGTLEVMPVDSTATEMHDIYLKSIQGGAARISRNEIKEKVKIQKSITRQRYMISIFANDYNTKFII